MRWLVGLPPAILVAVALCQIVLAQTLDLSPWVGGGFGMFASTDGRGYRHLHIFALQEGVQQEIFPPRALEDRVRRARSLPSERNLRRLALELGEHRTSTRAIRVQVFKTDFDRKTLRPTSHLLREVEVALVAAR
jgi:hypothetical protein